MTQEFQIIKLFEHHNRGQFIVVRQLNFKEFIEIKEGALLNDISVYHYKDMYPMLDKLGQPVFDICVLRPVLERFPKDYFKEGQIVQLVNLE